MTTLHIEHPVTDFVTWERAFARFAEARERAGVRSHVVRRPVDDAAYVSLDLEFDGPEAATAFLGFLRERVWAVPEASPALVGTPRASILEDAITSHASATHP